MDIHLVFLIQTCTSHNLSHTSFNETSLFVCVNRLNLSVTIKLFMRAKAS
jgi:hypothetical protein